MPLNGEYEPSPSERVRRQVELYEATNGAEGGTQKGKPVIVLTSQGAKSGKIRKIPLMRIEHNGVYAVVASHAGAPKNPFWYYNLVANPLVELQDGAVKQDMRAREVFGAEKNNWWKPTPPIRNSPIIAPAQVAKFRCSSWSPSSQPRRNKMTNQGEIHGQA